MQKQSAGLAREGEAYCKAELSFRSGGSMFFVLPDEDVQLQTLLTGRGLQELLTDEGVQNRTLPGRCRNSGQNGEMQLIDPAALAGSYRCFLTATQRISAMAGMCRSISVKYGRERLFSVDENGVEAAAYTEISMNETAALVEPEPPLEMRLDRPFPYGVRSADGTLLFVGVCADPTQED